MLLCKEFYPISNCLFKKYWIYILIFLLESKVSWISSEWTWCPLEILIIFFEYLKIQIHLGLCCYRYMMKNLKFINSFLGNIIQCLLNLLFYFDHCFQIQTDPLFLSFLGSFFKKLYTAKKVYFWFFGFHFS